MNDESLWLCVVVVVVVVFNHGCVLRRIGGRIAIFVDCRKLVASGSIKYKMMIYNDL